MRTVRSKRNAAAIAAAAFLLLACRQDRSEVLAVQYGTSLYPAELTGTDEPGPYVRMLWLFYVIRHGSRVVLVDTGILEPEHAKLYGIQNFRPAPAALRSAGIAPADVTDIILTHSHIDHVGGIAAFAQAVVHIQQSEYEYFQKTDRFDLFQESFAHLRGAGRIAFAGGNTEPFPGIRLIETAGHTPGSQAVAVSGDSGLLITGDECYFAAACRKGISLPEKASASVEKSRSFALFAQRFAGTLATLHDPAVSTYEAAGPGVYRIKF